MPYYRRVGEIPNKRHTQHRQASGALYHEELMGAEGFDGLSSILYHIAPPTGVQTIKAQPPVELQEYVGDVLRHHRFQTSDLSVSGDFLTARVPAFFNDDVVVSICTPDRATEAFYRNGECDELVYVHEGAGELLTPFGAIAYRQYDWIVIPRGTTVEWRPSGGQERLLIMESMTDIHPPSRYLSGRGQFLESSPYCERDLRGPEHRDPIDETGSFEVRVKSRRLVTGYWLDRHPFDVVGWDGCFYPYALNALDFEPIVQRIHTMPNVHQIFSTGGAAICNFVPRKADYHPLSIVAAPNHSSVDCDEILYLVSGQLSGRVGDGPGTTTLHPRGIPHGPKPGTYEKSIGIEEHKAIALMIDTFRPLKIAEPAMACDDPTYPAAWAK
jgi:homogentisate 1,2-dioxygenase